MVYLKQNFDSEVVGTTPLEWFPTVPPANINLTVSDQRSVSPSNSARLITNIAPTHVSQYYLRAISSDVGVEKIRFKFLSETLRSSRIVIGTEYPLVNAPNSGSIYSRLSFEGSGNIIAGGLAGQIIGTWIPNYWYSVELLPNIIGGIRYIQVWINSVYYGNIMCATFGVLPIKAIVLYNTQVPGRFYIDDLQVGEIPSAPIILKDTLLVDTGVVI